MAENEMIQYLRGDGNHPIGVMVAIYNDETKTVHIGWSKCNRKDQFSREHGLMIAKSRTLAGSILAIPASREFYKAELITAHDTLTNTTIDYPSVVIIPRLQEQYELFITRVVTYFKSVTLNNFIVCCPRDMVIHYANLITDARNKDLERQAARTDK